MAVLAFGAGRVALAGPPEQRTADRPRVLVVVAGDAERRAASLEVVRELVGRLDVEPIYRERDSLDVAALVRAPTGQSDYLAQVYIEVSQDPLAVYVIDGAYERILIRRVPAGGAFGEIEREQLATIAEGAVVALLDGGTIGVSRATAAAQLLPGVRATDVQEQREPAIESQRSDLPRPNADPTTAGEPGDSGEPGGRAGIGPTDTAETRDGAAGPADRDRTPASGDVNQTVAGVRLEAGYGFSLWSASAPPLHGPELGVRVFAPEVRTAPGLRLVTQAWIPQAISGRAIDGGDLGLRVGGLGVRALATLAPVQRGRFDLLISAGAGVDVLASRTAGSGTIWTPIGMAGLEAGPAIRFGPGFDAAFVLGLWFDLVDTRFVSSIDERLIFDPSRVRFGAQLRLTWGSAPRER